MAFDIYQKITDSIIERLKAGDIPWKQPYTLKNGDCAFSHLSKEPYSLLNQFLLKRKGEYFTFNQAKKEGLKIRKGAKASQVVFWKLYSPNDSGSQRLESDEDCRTHKIPLLRYYNVFHQDDVEGFVPKDENQFDESRNNEFREDADEIISKYIERDGRLKILNDSSGVPRYSPSQDVIFTPPKCQFTTLDEYYKTLFHECVHSTGHSSRLDRDFGRMFRTVEGMQDYSREELVAEIGASYLSNLSGLSELAQDNEIAYIQGWIKALQSDPKWIVWAASKAESAVRFILNDPKKEASEAEE